MSASAAATTLRFDGSQYFRMSMSEIWSRGLTTYNMSLRIRTRQSYSHLMTLTSSSRLHSLTLVVAAGRVKLRLPTPPPTHQSSLSSPFTPSRVSFIILIIYFNVFFCKLKKCLFVFTAFFGHFKASSVCAIKHSLSYDGDDDNSYMPRPIG